MSLGYSLYRIAGSLLSVAVPSIMRRRVQAGKENPERLNERFAKDLLPRPRGTLIWLHGASVGESQLLIEVAKQLSEIDGALTFLLTCQTLTGANIITAQSAPNMFHQMAPIDTPKIAAQFMTHWRPDLCVFAEGELWPNLIVEAERIGARRALINARMTAKSLKGWERWRALSKKMLINFDVILAADTKTAEGLSRLLNRKIESPGNLKSSLPLVNSQSPEITTLKETFSADRRCVLAASTHASEEAFFLDAAGSLDAALIIAPRHPDRADDVEALIKSKNLNCARRSKDELPNGTTDVYLADTIGEMGLWYALADAVYLGGAHAETVGGHNVLEVVKCERPVATGPHGYNFTDMFQRLENDRLIQIVEDRDALHEWLKAPPIPDTNSYKKLSAEFAVPMTTTIDALRPLLKIDS